MYGLNSWLAQESEFYPVFAMAVCFPDNSRRVDFQVEVSYNLAFRGVQAVNMPTDVPLPAAVAPTVAMCGTSTKAVYIEDLGDLHSSINRNPEAQDANWLYKTFKRADG